MSAPELARMGMARLIATRVALLGTVRRDGSPRISPIEPYLVDGQLLVGAMTWSGKVADLRRDPRYVLHSAVTDPDIGGRCTGATATAAALIRNHTELIAVHGPADDINLGGGFCEALSG